MDTPSIHLKEHMCKDSPVYYILILSTFMYMHTYVRTCIHMYMYTYVHVHVCTCIRTYLRTCICMYMQCTFVSVHMYVRMTSL